MKNNIVLSEIQKKQWVMEEKHLEGFCRQIAEITLSKDLFEKDNTFVLTEQDKILAAEGEGSNSLLTVKGNTAIIPIVGLLMKEVPRIYKYYEIFGIHTTSYFDIRAAVQEAVNDETVENILVHIDSPGGDVAGVQETAETIFKARGFKPVICYIEDLCASGGEWLGSQADKVYSNRNARVGGIGVYTVYFDWSKAAEEDGVKVHVIKSGEHKGMGEPGAPITDKQIESVQKYIDGIADNFISDVSRGRGMKKTEVRKIATGETWIAHEALSNGLIDGIMDLSEVMRTGFNSDVFNLEGDKGMDEEQAKKEKEAAVDAARSETEEKIRSEEKSRVAAINTQFAADPEFAMKAVSEGMTVEQAKAAYSDVLAERNKDLEAEKTELTVKLQEAEAEPGVEGNPGLDFQEGPDANADAGDFMEMAKEKVATGKCATMKEAMKAVNKENPGAHQAWFDKQKREPKEKEGTRIPQE